jgi:broad specificity phosphatase PhoE
MPALLSRSPLRRLLWLLALLAVSAVAGGAPSPPVAGVTTVVVVRHAEKAQDDPRDPSLSPEGELRAKALASALASAEVAAVYATEFKRTRTTGEPVAKLFHLTVEARPLGSGEVPAYARELAREIFAKHAGKTVVVVGHSNTVPQIVEALSGRAVEPFTDPQYDRLFVVLRPESGAARLIEARYGAPSP